MKISKSFLLLILPFLLFANSINAQVLISKNTGIPNESAMLQIDSDSKGVLIPRVTTTNREKITGVPGLLVYDLNKGSFFLYGKDDWVDLSSSAEIWSRSESSVFLTNSTDNIGIGTSPSTSKFVVQANSGSLPDAVLFEVKDDTGKPIFRVTSEGVRIYIKDKTKGVSGGFAVGQYGSLKTEGDDFFVVTPFKTRVNTLPGSKAFAGGFAVGQYASLKNGPITTNFYTNPSETRIYTDKATKDKAISGGFAVGQYGSLKADGDKYMHIEDDNIFIGNLAGVLTYDNGGVNNVFIGNNAGAANTTGNGNIFIGNNAGSTVLDNNKLFIDNGSSNPNVALVYGDFSTKAVNLNGRLRFNTEGNTITMPASRGSNNEVLTMNGSTGLTDWTDVNDLVPPPVSVLPRIVVTVVDQFTFVDEDNIGTLIVKTEEGKEMRTYLPAIKNNIDRVIKIKNSRPTGNIDLYTVNEDIIDGVVELPFLINLGETYTFQATVDENNGGKETWFIIDYTSEVLENVSDLLKETADDYDFDNDPSGEGPRVYTLVIINSEVGKIELPVAASYPNRIVVIKNGLSDGGKAQIYPNDNSTDRIDGNTNPISVMNPKESFTLQSDGKNNWHIINHYIP